jgi:hypothetical protein
MKDLWHALQNQEISRNDLLRALAQRSFTAPVPGDVPATAPGPADATVPVPADAAAPILVVEPAPAG